MSGRPAAMLRHRQAAELQAWISHHAGRERRAARGRIRRFHRVKEARCVVCWQKLDGLRREPGVWIACPDCADSIDTGEDD